MRIPGVRKPQAEALDEVAAQLTTCPVCGKNLVNDTHSFWDLRVVRARSCMGHGYFFIKWNPPMKAVSATWIFDRYLPE